MTTSMKETAPHRLAGGRERVKPRDPRETFAATAVELLEENDSVAVVYAEISGQYLAAARARHPDRVINVGIREQLLVNVGAGLALTGLRPVVHTFASFLVERPFEQVKLGFGHQGVGGVLVSTGGSFDVSAGGRTHQAPGDVALMSTLPEWSIVVPGHADEVEAGLRRAVLGSGRHYLRVTGQQNRDAHLDGLDGLVTIRSGSSGVVVAVGPVLDDVVAATEDLDLTVLYTARVRPFDGGGLRSAVEAGRADVVLVEPYLAGTSAASVSAALVDVPHRLLSLGTGNEEFRHYGTPAEHIRAQGLTSPGLRASILPFLGSVRHSRRGHPDVQSLRPHPA
jgi:transketolase